jgi:hypothetical protein
VYTHAPDWSCVNVPLSWGLGNRYYRHGASVSPDSFPSLAAVKTGSGRVRAHTATSEGIELRHEIGSGYDMVAGADCRATLFSDGTTRCAQDAFYGPYFSDAACTWPVVVSEAVGGTLVSIPRPKWLGRVDWTTTCTSLHGSSDTWGPMTLFNVAPMDPSTPVYSTPTGACALYTDVSVVAVYGATTPLAPTMFPLMPPDLAGTP